MPRVTPRGRPTVAFDFSGLDHLHIGNGQYRYCVDLINGLARLQAPIEFIVFGSRPTPPQEIAAVFGQLGWRYVEQPASRGRGAMYLAHARFAWRLRTLGVDLLHAPHTFLPLLSRIKSVVTIYDLMPELFPEYHAMVSSRPYRMFKYAVQRRRPHVIAISHCTASDLQRLWHIPASDVSVVHLAVSPAQQASAALPSGVRSPFILAPHNLEPRKNLGVLLDAMSLIRQTHTNLQLVLFGRAALTPEREKKFQADVERLGLQNAVLLTGFVSDAELKSLYEQAALFVFPSVYEGFGLPVLEAMAAGACVIGHKASAIAEVMGEAGVQVNVRDPNALAGAITGLLADPGRRRAVGQAGRKRAAQFTQEAMANHTLAVYMRSLDRPISAV